MEKIEYRPVMAEGLKGMFHGWGESVVYGLGDELKTFTVALVERADGRIDRVLPEKVTFTDRLHG
jgi:hypothetical protein